MVHTDRFEVVYFLGVEVICFRKEEVAGAVAEFFGEDPVGEWQKGLEHFGFEITIKYIFLRYFFGK